MRDRHKLAEDGMIVIVMSYSSYDHRILGDPEIVTRGFIYVKEAEELMDELKRVTLEAVQTCEKAKIVDWSTIKSKVKSNIAGYLFRTVNRSPMILPVISEV
jgi:ribonuclease J